MKKRFLLIPALVLMAAPPAYAAGNQLVIAPSVSVASKSSQFDFIVSGSPAGTLARPTYMTMSPSLAISKGKLFARISTDFTIEPAQYEDFVAGTSIYYDNRGTYRRGESSINIGYRFYEGKLGSANVFAGFLSGTSSLATTTTTYDSTATPAFVYSSETTKFYESGPFIGANFTHPFGRQALTVSLALAGLKGNLDDTYSSSDPASAPGNDYYDAKSGGLSFGLVWSGPMSKNMDYKIGYKFVDYSYDVTALHDLVTGITYSVTPGTVVIKEKINSFYVGSTIYF
jgi:hypothetical protein